MHPMGDLTSNLFGSAVYSGASATADSLIPGSSFLLTAGNALFGGPSSVSPSSSGTITNIPGSDYLVNTAQFPDGSFNGIDSSPVTTPDSGSSSSSGPTSVWSWLGLPAVPSSVSLLPSLPSYSVFGPSTSTGSSTTGQTTSWLIPAAIGAVLLIVIMR